jgi:hypothetical protein
MLLLPSIPGVEGQLSTHFADALPAVTGNTSPFGRLFPSPSSYPQSPIVITLTDQHFCRAFVTFVLAKGPAHGL